MPRLLAGDSAFLRTLQAQYQVARIESVELSGVGFFITYSVPDVAPQTDPLGFSGGMAQLDIAELEYGAGCVLFVRDGYLFMFEVYIVDPAWPTPATLVGVEVVQPPEPGRA